MTQRSAFVLEVRPERIDEYIEAHGKVWPEMLDALRRAGIRNYTIFRNGTQVFGYFESDDLEAASRFMAAAGGVGSVAGRDGGTARGARPGRRRARPRGDLQGSVEVRRRRHDSIHSRAPFPHHSPKLTAHLLFSPRTRDFFSLRAGKADTRQSTISLLLAPTPPPGSSSRTNVRSRHASHTSPTKAATRLPDACAARARAPTSVDGGTVAADALVFGFAPAARAAARDPLPRARRSGRRLRRGACAEDGGGAGEDLSRAGTATRLRRPGSEARRASTWS